MDGADLFDNKFFGLSPMEAKAGVLAKKVALGCDLPSHPLTPIVTPVVTPVVTPCGCRAWIPTNVWSWRLATRLCTGLATRRPLDRIAERAAMQMSGVLRYKTTKVDPFDHSPTSSTSANLSTAQGRARLRARAWIGQKRPTGWS